MQPQRSSTCTPPAAAECGAFSDYGAMADVPIALLAGGLATRLRPITTTIPKALVEVAGEPFIDHQLRLLARNGAKKVVMCIGYLGEMIEAHCRDGSQYGLELSYVPDGPRLLGTGGALRQALPHLGEAFWILYGDSYMDIDYPAVLAAFQQRGKQGLMTVLRNGDRWDKSNVVFQQNRLISYDKRHPTPEMEYIDYGASLLKSEVIAAHPLGEVFDLADVYHELVKQGEMTGYEVTQRFYEIGSHQGLKETEDYLRQRAA